MKRSGKILEEIGGKAVQIMVIGILAYLSYWTAVSTFRYALDYLSRDVHPYADSPLKNLLAAGAVVLIFYLFRRLILWGDNKDKQRERILILALADVLIVGVLLAVWVTVSRLEPTNDQYMVYEAAKMFRQGDYSAIQNFFYYQMYAHQYGLIFLEELVIFVWQSYRLIQYLNVFFICLILFVLYRVTDLLFEDPAVDLYCLMGTTAFLPLHLYVTYVYGDVCSIALSLVAVWCLLRWEKEAKWRYMALAALCALIAGLARKNTLVPLLAIAIVCVFLAWKKWSWKPVLFGILLLVLPLGGHRGVRALYELRAGLEISDGLPATAWIAMGMQEDWGAHGTWNGFTEHVWGYFAEEENAQDARKEYVMWVMQTRTEEFAKNPEIAREFYHYKILEQWSEPSYSSLMMTGDSAVGKGGVTEWLYLGAVPDFICRFQNYFQFVLYFLSLCCLINALRQREPIQNHVLLIAVVGGFLFSILWEARARYVLSYAVFLLPYMARGARVIQDEAGLLAKHIYGFYKTKVRR